MTQREKLVAVALARLGDANGAKYVDWYNKALGGTLPLNSAWCALFVSWCAREAGLTAGQVPTYISCTAGRRLFKQMGIWFDREKRTPLRGDIVLFDWDDEPSVSEHTGIVTGADDQYVYTVEGNAGIPGRVAQRRYKRHSGEILGYAAWIPDDREKEDDDMTKEETLRLIQEAAEDLRRELAPARYRTPEDVPLWGRATVRRLMVTGRLKGDEKGNIDLSADLLRALVIMDRGENLCA